MDTLFTIGIAIASALLISALVLILNLDIGRNPLSDQPLVPGLLHPNSSDQK